MQLQRNPRPSLPQRRASPIPHSFSLRISLTLIRSCFIRQIGLNSYSDEYYSDDGYDFEEEMRAYMENDPEGFYLEYLASP